MLWAEVFQCATSERFIANHSSWLRLLSPAWQTARTEATSENKPPTSITNYQDDRSPTCGLPRGSPHESSSRGLEGLALASSSETG